MPTYRLIVSGKVQGVFYRCACMEKAKSLDIVGYAKNLEDGKVEIVCSGKKPVLQDLIDWCKKGPSSAKVENVVIEKANAGEYADFKTY